MFMVGLTCSEIDQNVYYELNSETYYISHATNGRKAERKESCRRLLKQMLNEPTSTSSSIQLQYSLL